MSPEWFTDKNGDYALDSSGQKIEKPADSLLSVGSPTTMLLFERAPTAPQLARFMELYNATERIYGSGMEGELYAIISEEADAFFAGDKTVDQAVSLIQSRVSLYVNEQR